MEPHGNSNRSKIETFARTLMEPQENSNRSKIETPAKYRWNRMNIPIHPKSKHLQKHRWNRMKIQTFPSIFSQKFHHRVKEFYHRFKLSATILNKDIFNTNGCESKCSQKGGGVAIAAREGGRRHLFN